jgi:cytochrome c oxidase subunit 4
MAMDITVTHGGGVDEHEPGSHAHPGVREYLIIGLILAVVTAVEVGLYYVPEQLLPIAVANPILVILAAAKFIMVVGWFMHLRFDNRLFSGLFVFGLAVAAAMMLALIALFLLAPVHHPSPNALGLHGDGTLHNTGAPKGK